MIDANEVKAMTRFNIYTVGVSYDGSLRRLNIKKRKSEPVKKWGNIRVVARNVDDAIRKIKQSFDGAEVTSVSLENGQVWL